MDSEGHHQDDPIIVTMFEGSSDNDALWEERNTLAVALRRIHQRCLDGGEGVRGGVYLLANRALAEVFHEDPLGEKAIYDCPAADGRNRLREEADHGAD